MSRSYKFHNQDKPYFVTFATVNWIDVFTRNIYKDILVDSLNFNVTNKGLLIYSWCIMTNHVHMIIGTKLNPMQDIMRDLKSYTSKEILKAIKDNPRESRKNWMLWMFERAGKRNSNNTKYQFWQQHNHPIQLDDNKIFDQKMQYIYQNPVVAGFVDKAEHFPYSSAKDYAGENGFVKVEFA